MRRWFVRAGGGRWRGSSRTYKETPAEARADLRGEADAPGLLRRREWLAAGAVEGRDSRGPHGR